MPFCIINSFIYNSFNQKNYILRIIIVLTSFGDEQFHVESRKLNIQEKSLVNISNRWEILVIIYNLFAIVRKEI